MIEGNRFSMIFMIEVNRFTDIYDRIYKFKQ